MSPDPQEPSSIKNTQPRRYSTKIVAAVVLLASLLSIGYFITGGVIFRPQGSTATDDATIAGAKLYSRYCTSCHGYAVETLKSTFELEQMLSPQKPETSPHSFSEALDRNDLRAVAEYVIAGQGRKGSLLLGSLSTIYVDNCAGCHGPRGDQLPNANLASKGFWERRDSYELTGSLVRGGKGMPAFGRAWGGQLTEEEIGGLVQSLGARAMAEDMDDASADSETAEVARLYAYACAACHGQKGDLLARFDLSSKGFWRSADEGSLAASIIEGKGGMPPLGQGRGGFLTEGQVEAIIGFLKAKAVEGAREPGPASRPDSTPAQSAQATDDQIPLPAPFDSKHDEGWGQKHAGYVLENGAGRCYKCHDNTYCVDCHVRR